MSHPSLLITAEKAQGLSDQGRKLPALTCKIKPSETVVILSIHSALSNHYMKILAGQKKLRSGLVTLLNKDNCLYSEKERLQLNTKIAYVLHDNSLLSTTNGYNNLTLAARYHRLDKDENINKKALSLIRQMPNQSEQSKLPSDMSEIFKRHLCIARPLMLDPLALFIEQPFLGLSYYEKTLIEKYIGQIKQERQMALIISTDDLLLTHKHADKIIYCDKEDVLFFDNWNAFYHSPQKSIAALFKIQRIKRDG